MVDEDVVKGRATPNSVSELDGGQQGAGVHGGEVVRVQGGTRRHRCKRRRGSGDGARGQQRVVVGIDGWDGSGVSTHTVLRINLCTHLHKWVDERQSPIARRPPQQRAVVLRTDTHERRSRKSEGVWNSSPLPRPLQAQQLRPIGPSPPHHGLPQSPPWRW